MRYGIIRDASFLCASNVQRSALEKLNCDVVIQERGSSPDGIRRIDRLLSGVKRGDEIAVQSLGVFLKTTGEVVRTLRDLLEIGATVILTPSADDVLKIEPSDDLIELLTLLAEHESNHPNEHGARRRGRTRATGRIGGGSRNPLSPYQIDYARKLRGEGASLRSIGLLFQLSPEEIWQIVGR